MKRKRTNKPYWEMSAEELQEATKQFDKPIRLSKTKPLTREQRAQWERMRKTPARSIFITRDSDGIFVRLDPDILRRSTRYAAEHKMTLSDVVNRSLRGMLAIVE